MARRRRCGPISTSRSRSCTRRARLVGPPANARPEGAAPRDRTGCGGRRAARRWYPEVNTISAPSVGSRSATSAGGSCGRSSSMTTATSAVVIVETPSGSSAARPSSATHSAGLAARTRSSRSVRRSCVLHGSTIAPIRQQARIVSAHSIRLPTRVITTSPRPTPRAASAPDSPALLATSSPKPQTRRSPSAEIVTRAGRADGNRSRTSSMKFMRRRRSISRARSLPLMSLEQQGTLAR